jgi:cobaltochelatase CobN
MHLLASTTGVIDGNAEAVDLAQHPADIVVLSAADSELASLARAFDRNPVPLRLASLLRLQHPMSVDLYAGKTLAHAKLIVLRLLGGASYWRYGLEQVEALARDRGIMLAVLPGDAQPDPELTRRSSLPPHHCERLRQYLAAGGAANSDGFLAYCKHLTEQTEAPAPAIPPAPAGLYRGTGTAGQPLAALIFYRSVIDGGQTAPIDALIDELSARGIATRAFYVASLKDAASIAAIRDGLSERSPDIILNATSFAVAAGGVDDPLAAHDCPVLQVVLAGSSEARWRDSPQGLDARDLAMNVVLPELDGRILSRAISFKAEDQWHAGTQCPVLTYRTVPDRVSFVAGLAASWIRLRRAPPAARKVAVILANYPNRDGRIANGVGYDTPASTVAILAALREEGYAIADFPATGNALIATLQKGPTNAAPHKLSTQTETFPLADYLRHFAALPETVREQITTRWGDPCDDPFFAAGGFRLPVIRNGNAAVAIQPARGYNIDPKSSYHDPALPPPHGYLAFYMWVRHVFGAHAVIHNGKHGNLEWLPGKATALSAECLPETILGPMPQLYPFIINDPGEGTQAKRRTAAVIISHLTPPLTRAETYGPLKDLEALVDEYYLAAGLDPRRRDALRRDILALTTSTRLDADAGFTGDEEQDLQRLDALLCDLKEAQIRDGLHVLGTAPEGRLETDLLVALTRVPRGLGEDGNQSITRALAADFRLTDFDPLSCAPAEAWTGPRPAPLADITAEPWRSNGDTVERLELFAASLLEGLALPPGMTATAKVLERIDTQVRPLLRASGPCEIAALIKGLNGRLVAPGPSGAPTRGRLDVLPTGRNFYSLDNRTLPTPAAWALGRKSAEELLLRHFQDFGRYPKALGLSAWGTSNMRTGGDDIAQALALIGVKPVWDTASWRVSGFDVLPLAKLGRPRVDVTLRISGFFRDAFPAQIELLDKAMRAVGALDEDEEDNPLAHRMAAEARALAAAGLDAEDARRVAGHRIFGAKPGAYGAGLQALIDEKIWTERADLAAAYVTWGAYAYGADAQGVRDEDAFLARLKRIEAVVHNQDNREHDLLDSDDYYQFEGGMTAAVEQASGSRPRVYHNDHSRPERPVIRTLEEEVSRVMRARVVNPKWIAGVKRHGYKGAFEIAATVDYMFAFAATTGAVRSHHFDLAYDAFVADGGTRNFIAENNPAALKEIAQRLAEAAARGLWTPRLNSAHDVLEELMR